MSDVGDVVEAPIADWRGQVPAPSLQSVIERGGVVACPSLAFDVTADERALFGASLADDRRKSIYRRAGREGLTGTTAEGATRDVVASMIERFADASHALIDGLFPSYRAAAHATGTSFRPRAIGDTTSGRALSWRKDDTRLHVDAFPSNPTHGERILRVFTNVHPDAMPRRWRVGERFETMARRFLPATRALPPGAAWLMHRLGITKRPRTPYDHLMLQLHDLAKADLDYQRTSAAAHDRLPARHDVDLLLGPGHARGDVGAVHVRADLPTAARRDRRRRRVAAAHARTADGPPTRLTGARGATPRPSRILPGADESLVAGSRNAMALRTVRIFISSPGDVAEERLLARRLIGRLDAAVRRRAAVRVDPVGALPARRDRDRSRTSSCGRATATSSSSSSGRGSARRCHRTSSGPTDRRTRRAPSSSSRTRSRVIAPKVVRTSSRISRRRRSRRTATSRRSRKPRRRRRALERFVTRWFRNEADGTLKGAFHRFATPADFEDLLEAHLTQLAESFVPPGVARHSRAPTWLGRSPFRGLQAFEPEHAPVFFGRTAATASRAREAACAGPALAAHSC